jgi:hypothetical protein
MAEYKPLNRTAWLGDIMNRIPRISLKTQNLDKIYTLLADSFTDLQSGSA